MPSISDRLAARLGVQLLCVASICGMAAQAWAFDASGFRSRLDATLAEVTARTVPDLSATLARLDEMVTLGKVGAQEYAARRPQFAKLMGVAIGDANTLNTLTDGEIEDRWGENGSAGDAVGIPLKSLGQFDETRAYLELIVGPSHAYIFIRKWASNHKGTLFDKAEGELTELAEHLKQID